MSTGTKKIITILALLLFWPAGVILMFVWKLWSKTVRIVITVAIILLNLIMVGLIVGGFALLFSSIDSEVTGTGGSQTTLTSGGEMGIWAIPTSNYAIGTTAMANGYEMSVDDFATYQAVNSSDETVDYCAVSFTITNLADEALDISEFIDFELKAASGSVMEQYLGFGSTFTTQPASAYTQLGGENGDSSISLDKDMTTKKFMAFDCKDNTGSFVFTSNLNQFTAPIEGDYWLDDNMDFAPVKFDLSL